MENIPKNYDQIDQWKSLMFLYSSALKEINVKIEILNNEFIQIYNYNPIEHVKSRLKTPESIVKKLKRMGAEVNVVNMTEKISDIAGIRIICSFTSDIYQIARHDLQTEGCDGPLHQRLHQESKTEWLQKLSYGSDDPGLSDGWAGGDQGGDPDPDGGHGFLGQSGA